MRIYHAAAVSDLERALELRRRLMPAYRRLLDMANAGGAGRAREGALLRRAVESCELCADIRAAQLRNLTPRWGGSMEEMEESPEAIRRRMRLFQ